MISEVIMPDTPNGQTPHDLGREFSGMSADGVPVELDEIAYMLEHDMTLDEAAKFHLDVWGLPPDFQFEHDVSHLIMGLSTGLDGDGDYPYQGTYEAEIYTVANEMAFLDSGSGNSKTPEEMRTDFLSRVQDNFDIYGDEENLNRTLVWALKQKGVSDADDLFEQNGFKSSALMALAAQHGIEAERRSGTWGVDIPDMDERFWFVDDRKNYMPDDIEGVQNFVRFNRPSEDDVSAIYERMRPGLAALNERIDDYVERHGKTAGMSGRLRRELGQIKVRELYQEMVNGYRPGLSNLELGRDRGGADWDHYDT